MKKILLAGILGGFVLTLWGMVAWMLLPLHDASMNKIDNEEEVTEVLLNFLPKHGVYVIPGYSEDLSGLSEEDREARTILQREKYKRGPIGTIIFKPDGSDPYMIQQIIVGFLISICTALLAAWLLARSTAIESSFIGRVSFCGLLGIFASLVTHATYWNWMSFPFDYTTAMILDTVVGWILAGVIIATFVKPAKA